ncbi:MAG TPA: glycosyltransferase family 4 protein [Polyangiaceae bacterium]|jgi:glycosyltransferase involved in cell wall biosynthesis|nr:glycosyltransferase family 4 protein [Polyangiaceae bacterium]
MRVLIITKIFPNRLEPLSSPFNRLQFSALKQWCQVEVLATIPWFPGISVCRRWSQAARLVEVPRHESIDGLRVAHPRFAYVPRLARGLAGPLYAASLAAVTLRYRGRVDIVLGSWAYPDGFAAVTLAKMLGVPSVVKLHGSDMNVVARWRGPRRHLNWALPRADRVVAVSRPLAAAATALGVSPERIDVVSNGIDRDLFHPRDRSEARRALQLPVDRRLLLYVGHLTENKGAFDLIQAFTEMNEAFHDVQLVMIGDGTAAPKCHHLALRATDRVRFTGPLPQEQIPTWLAACDVLALPSWNEGTPNVVLEALASGRCVVASNVGGIPDIVRGKPHALVPPKDVTALRLALEQALGGSYDPAEIATTLNFPDWTTSAGQLHASLRSALSSRAREAA